MKTHMTLIRYVFTVLCSLFSCSIPVTNFNNVFDFNLILDQIHKIEKFIIYPLTQLARKYLMNYCNLKDIVKIIIDYINTILIVFKLSLGLRHFWNLLKFCQFQLTKQAQDN